MRGHWRRFEREDEAIRCFEWLAEQFPGQASTRDGCTVRTEVPEPTVRRRFPEDR